ncbi:hypothetical protein H2198_002004 [Neophaeococcomyces mojaviensis]|uniref:Uncharacterized protein n=1 Tax=Neophaeococcomyces mojaviensis TaxID=3383035 RepID=A0ACC3AFI1_9EURO|nr:hypothetical protein H2198_002004 [Knufia sp. JES_112]
MSNQVTVQPASWTSQKSDILKTAETKIETLTLNDLKNPPKETEAPAPPTQPAYTCITQEANPASVASIVVGLFTSIPRWKLGSTINFATSATGYPTPADAVYAAKMLIEAADEWNSYKVGVRFNWVSNVDDATFVLAYGGDKGTVLASAFFPNAAVLNTLWVYSHSFDKNVRDGGWSNYSIMKNVFLHELGHVLGLRHEFALDADKFEGGAFRLGTTNPLSVMSYEFPPKIQDTDILDTRAFYKLPLLEFFAPDN